MAWRKFPHWLRGGLIGSSAFAVLFVLICFPGLLLLPAREPPLGLIIVLLSPGFLTLRALGMTIQNIPDAWRIWFLAVVSLSAYGLLGALVGGMIGKTKSR